MQSAPANHLSLLPVFDIGSSGGAPRATDDSAFDELLSAPPACPPPPRPAEPRHPTEQSAPAATAPPAETADADVQAGAAPETPPSETEAQAEQVTAENAEDEDKSDTGEQPVAESLAGLAAVIPPAPLAPPVPDEEVVADAAPPVIEPAAHAPAGGLGGESPAVTPVTAIDSIANEAEPPTAEQKDRAPAEADAKSVEPQLVLPIQEVGAAASDGGQTATPADGQGRGSSENTNDDSREGDSAHSEIAAALPNDAALASDQQTAKSPEAAPPPAPAAEAKANAVDSARPAPSVTPGIEAAGHSAPRSRLPATLLAREPSGAHPATQVDSVRLLNRVARAFAAAQQREGGEIQLRLSPAELGSLRLLVQVHEGALSARLEAETPAARTALIENLPALREKLAEQGVRIERFDVDLMQRQPGGMPQQPQDQERSAPPPRFTNTSRPAAPPPARPLAPRTAGPGQLNVIV